MVFICIFFSCSRCWTPFLVFICHLYILFREMSVHVFCPFSIWIVRILLLSFESSLYILDNSPLLDMWSANIFSQSVACPCILLQGFHRAKVLNFDKVQFISFSFYGSCFGVKSKDFLPSSSKDLLLCFFLIRFIVLRFALKFVIQHHLLKRLSFCWIVFAPLSKITWTYLCGSISGFSILFHWPMCLSLCQPHCSDYGSSLVSINVM